MNKLNPIKFSDSEVTVLGYNAAGWGSLEAGERVAGRTVYGFGNTPVQVGDSYYLEHYQRKQISDAKAETFNRFAVSALIASIESLDRESKNTLIDIANKVNDYLYVIDTESPLEHLAKEETLASKLQGNIKSFLQCIGCASKKQVDLEEGFAQKLEEILNNLEQLRPHSKSRLDEFVSADHFGLQQTIWESKRVIVDTLQENIRRYHAGEPLIPIKMVIRANVGTAEMFSPDPESIEKKQDVFITPTELRMLYKLTHEIPDELCQHIMQQSVVFLEKRGDGFVPTTSPWEQSLWKDRPRGQRGESRPAYADRDKSELPNWLVKMIENKGEKDEEISVVNNSTM